MNKGLFIHLLIAFLTIISIMIVVGEENTTMKQRGAIVFCFFMCQFVVGAVCDILNYYSQKIKI